MGPLPGRLRRPTAGPYPLPRPKSAVEPESVRRGFALSACLSHKRARAAAKAILRGGPGYFAGASPGRFRGHLGGFLPLLVEGGQRLLGGPVGLGGLLRQGPVLVGGGVGQ